MNWVLVIVVHVGVMGSGNSNAITQITGFTNIQKCTDAAERVHKITEGTVKEIRTMCIKVD